MKKLNYIFTIFALGMLFTACKKNSFSVKENTFIDGQASLKVNFFSATQAKPAYQIKIYGNRVSSNLTYPTPFPGGGLNTGGGSYADYFAVAPGSRKVDISIPNVGTNTDSILLASATVDLAANKVYSLYYVDTAANLTTILLEDDLTSPDSGFVKYRFVNLMPDVAAGLDLYFGTGSTSTTSVKVAGPILFKDKSDYFNLPINSTATAPVWSLRPGGALATTTAIATYTSASSVVNQRVFTVSSRGFSTISTPSTDGRIRAISFIYNR